MQFRELRANGVGKFDEGHLGKHAWLQDKFLEVVTEHSYKTDHGTDVNKWCGGVSVRERGEG